MNYDKTIIVSTISLLLILITFNTAMAEFIPPDPRILATETGNFWVNNTYEAGSANEWYMISGATSGLFTGYEWTDITWQSNATITNGLGDIGGYSTPSVFEMDGMWRLLSGETYGDFYGFDWNGTGWESNSTLDNGISTAGSHELTCVFEMDGTWYLMVGHDYMASISGYKWTGTTWQSNSTIVNGLTSYAWATPHVFEKNEIVYLIIGDHYGAFHGYNWTGSAWQADSAIVNGLGDVGSQASPTVLYVSENWYLISGENEGEFFGFKWNGTGWNSDSSISANLVDVGYHSSPEAFNMGNFSVVYNVTDSYNVSVNDTWYNGTTDAFFNNTGLSAHGWSNITVYAYNSSGSGTLSSGSISQNTQLSNNPITITNTSDWDGDPGQNVYVDYDATDADSDTPIFSCSRTDLFTDFDTSTGTGNWTAVIGVYYVDFGVSDGYGSTDNYTMTISSGFYPPDPINIANTTGNFWVNHTWEPGSGTVTDSYNVSVNGTWYNTTTDLFYNDTYSAHDWQNITVWAYNISDPGSLSLASLDQNTQIPTNPPVITNTSNWDGSDGEDVYVDFDATDLDGDTPTFSCNRTDLFTDFNTATGQGNYISVVGLHYVDFGVDDGYGGTDNYTMTIMGNVIPELPENLANYSENLWVNYTWTAGGEWYLFVGENTGVTLYGFNWNGSDWQSDSAVVSGITGLGSRPAPEMFYMDDILYLIAGNYGGEFDGFNWTGSAWQIDTAIMNGLTDLGRDSRPAIFQKDGTWYLILAQGYGNWYGYNWTGTIWQSDSAIISGITSAGDTQAPEVFQMGNDWYLIAGQNDGTTIGYQWNGTGWNSDSAIVSGITDVGQLTNPSVFQKNGIWYNIAGTYAGPLYGFNWTGTTWQSDTVIKGNIGDLGQATSPGNIFMATGGNTTDGFNVSVNGVWYNGTNTSHENTYSPHTWANITIFAYNSSGSGTLSTSSISQNTQVANSPVTITNTSDWSGNYSENVYVDFDATDLDSDTPTFSCDRTDLFTDFNTATGQGNWTAVGGTYSVDFGVSDGWGGTDNYTMTITVTEPFVPPDPFNIANSTGDLWINHTWEKLTGVSTSEWYILDGDSSGGLYGFNWSGTAWQSDSAITGGLPSFGTYASPAAFDIGDTTYLLGGNLTSYLSGYSWTGSTWQVDSAMASGLTGLPGEPKKPFGFEMGGTGYLIIPTVSSGIFGYDWTGSTWQSNAGITSGLPGFVFFPSLTVFEMGSTWYLMLGDISGAMDGYSWTGSTWTSDTSIEAGYPGGISVPSPRVFQKDGTHYLIVGDSSGVEHGFNWTGSAWQADSAIVGGLGTRSNDHRAISVFEIGEPAPVTTDSFNISVNDVWYNGSTNLFYNETYSAHSWQNITVYAYNSSIYGALSENSISQSTQLSNNPITLTDVSVSYSLNESETFTLDANYTDADNDTAVFSDNSSNWTINSATGEVSWLTTSDDVGTHHYRITVDDGYGSTDYQDFTVTVGEVMEVLSTDPIGDFDLDFNEAQELSAELNFNATVVWYVDEVETQTEYNTTTPDFYFTSLTGGEFNVTFVATDPIGGTSDSFTWIITVIDEDQEVRSVYASPPRRDIPIREVIEDYVPGIWDDFEEVENVLTTEIPDENLWWLVLMLTVILFIAYYYKD